MIVLAQHEAVRHDNYYRTSIAIVDCPLPTPTPTV